MPTFIVQHTFGWLSSYTNRPSGDIVPTTKGPFGNV